MTTRGTSSATSQGRRSRRAHVPATVSASVLILILILILVLVVGAGACAGGGGRSLDTAGTTSSTTTVVRRVGTTGPPEAGPPDAAHGRPVVPTSGSTFSREPCPAAALGSFSMTDEQFRRSYADGLAGPDAHLYELMRTFRVEHVAALQERGVCIGSIGVGISASTGTSLGPSSPHRLVIGIRTDRFTPETKVEVLATFSDPASVVVEAAPEYHAGMG